MRNPMLSTSALLATLSLVAAACTGNIEPTVEQTVEPKPMLETKIIQPAKMLKTITETAKSEESILTVLDEAVELILDQQPVDEDRSPELQVVYFEMNKSKTPDKYIELLLTHVDYLKQHPEMMVNVSGHADVSGNARSNKKLSEKRTQSIAKFLMVHGVPEGQIQKSSFGDNLPLTDMENKDENRRVELHYSQIYTLK